MKLHRILSALLFIPIAILYFLSAFFELLFNILNSFNYHLFWSFPVPEILNEEFKNSSFGEIILRIAMIFSGVLNHFTERLKDLRTYKF